MQMRDLIYKYKFRQQKMQMRKFIDNLLYCQEQICCQVTVQVLSKKLFQFLSLHQQTLIKIQPITVSKIAGKLKQPLITQKIQSLQTNEIFNQSLNEVAELFIQFAYGHHQNNTIYMKHKTNTRKFIKNIIGIYQISKMLVHSNYSNVLDQNIKNSINQSVLKTLFIHPIFIYKEIYYRIQQSYVFESFFSQLFQLINQRIKSLFCLYGIEQTNDKLRKTCIEHIRTFMEQTTISESLTSKQLVSCSNRLKMQSQSQQSSFFSIDQLILCFIYLTYKKKSQNIRFCLIMEQYQKCITKNSSRNNMMKQHNLRVVSFYNQHYLSLYQQHKLAHIDKYQFDIDQNKAKQFTCQLVQTDITILDHYMSSLEA